LVEGVSTGTPYEKGGWEKNLAVDGPCTNKEKGGREKNKNRKGKDNGGFISVRHGEIIHQRRLLSKKRKRPFEGYENLSF